MRLRPVGWRLYVRPIEGEDVHQVGEVLKKLNFEIKRGMDEDETRRALSGDDVGIVVAIGPLAWQRQDLQGNRAPHQWEDWCKVGDKIIFGRYAGKLKQDPETNEWLILINDEDVQCVIDPLGDFERLGLQVADEIEDFGITFPQEEASNG